LAEPCLIEAILESLHQYFECELTSAMEWCHSLDPQIRLQEGYEAPHLIGRAHEQMEAFRHRVDCGHPQYFPLNASRLFNVFSNSPILRTIRVCIDFRCGFTRLCVTAPARRTSVPHSNDLVAPLGT
jgi:hypothetical protein